MTYTQEPQVVDGKLSTYPTNKQFSRGNQGNRRTIRRQWSTHNDKSSRKNDYSGEALNHTLRKESRNSLNHWRKAVICHTNLPSPPPAWPYAQIPEKAIVFIMTWIHYTTLSATRFNGDLLFLCTMPFKISPFL